MAEFGDHPAAALLRGFKIDDTATVSLARVVRQRAAFADLYAATLLQPSLDALLEQACRVAAEGCEAPLAKVLEHKPEERQFLVRAGVGWAPGIVGHARADDDPSNPAGESLKIRAPVTVRDVRKRPDYHLPPIYPNHHIVSSANVPIMGTFGFYGVLEVDRREERPFDALDSSFLAGIAGILADAIERVRRFATLQAALDARGALLREHNHRVRNSYQAIIARVQRHAAQATSENSRRRFEDIERRLFALAALYDHLVGLDLPGDRVDLARYLGDLCERMRAFHAIEERTIELACACGQASVPCDLDTCTALGIVVNELVANAVEHAFASDGGRIEVRLERGGDGPRLVVADNGSGFAGVPAESIGLAGVERLVAGIGATLTRRGPEDGPGSGTVWTIALPKSDEGR